VRAGGARRGSGVRGLLRVPLRVAAAALLAVATLGTAAAAELVYEVTLDPAKPTTAQVRLAAPAGERFLATAPVQARGAQIGVAIQAERLSCDGRGVPLRKDGWHLPRTGCRELTWTIAFDTLGPLGVDASNQQNLYDPVRKFWLVSEPASLLRAPGTESGALIEFRGVGEVLGGMARGSAARRTVPGLDAAPEFYFAGGSLPTRRFVAGGRPVVYLKVAEADYAAIERVHRAGLDYLAQVVRATPTTEPSIVVWLPIEESQRATGGAAGSSSILANVATVEGRAQPLRLPFAQLLVLHEQFHQLAPQPLPHWLNESLAEYYARKALRRADPGVGALHLVERRYPPLTAPPRQTLLAVQRQIDDGDFSAYGLLYTEGSNFWLAVDQAILAASAGKRSLDDELPFLLTAEYPQGRLPPAVVERLRAAAGASAFDELLVEWVGQSP
jgi:hypothetical protein